MTEIVVNKLHSDAMLESELRAMLGTGEIKLTLGGLMGLVLVKSPYVFGGKVDENSLLQAYTLIAHGDLDAVQFHNALQDELDTAFRVFELLVPDDDPTAKKGKTSEMETFSPEWFADIMSHACQAMPSLSYDQILGQIPLTMIFHLNLSTARRNGAITRRPDNIKEALNILKERRLEKK